MSIISVHYRTPVSYDETFEIDSGATVFDLIAACLLRREEILRQLATPKGLLHGHRDENPRNYRVTIKCDEVTMPLIAFENDMDTALRDFLNCDCSDIYVTCHLGYCPVCEGGIRGEN